MSKGVQIQRRVSPASAENLSEQPVLRDFFLGFIKIHVLHHAARDSVYGLQLIEELARHGYHLPPGTLYPVLHGLEKSGHLKRQERLVGGKIRKYYRATPSGEKILGEVREKIVELVAEVLQAEGPTSLPEEEDTTEA